LPIKAGEEVVGGIGVAGAPGGEATKLAQRQDSTPLRTSHRNDSRACVSTGRAAPPRSVSKSRRFRGHSATGRMRPDRSRGTR
jgi:hypothetical protein